MTRSRRSITRRHRTLFVLMIDQSGSMADIVPFRGKSSSKAEAVAYICNSAIREMILRATREDGVRNYYDILVVGYSGSGVVNILGEVDGSPFIPVNRLKDFVIDSHGLNDVVDMPDGGGNQLRKGVVQRWITPTAYGETPMHEALTYIYSLVKAWSEEPKNIDAYPPIIFNITDGITSDCNLDELSYVSDEIKSLKSVQGEALLMNIHISQISQAPQRVLFPMAEDVVMNRCQYFKALYDTASYMPEEFNEHICKYLNITNNDNSIRFKGLGYNSSFSDIFAMLNIGSISVRRA